ncbi:hypothetical protein [uncultured Roseibium sp.]|uniref:hypothetical protein n=1 Tax=uncultured Roseibium sp. TaxID=1936171 RepID=UPI0026358E47|nr:hypothetical protein [uncultured Roseibium sp.]
MPNLTEKIDYPTMELLTGSSDFKRGAQAAYATEDVCDQATTDEVLAAGGPDFMAGQQTDEPPEWHRGWDWTIRMARQQA